MRELSGSELGNRIQVSSSNPDWVSSVWKLLVSVPRVCLEWGAGLCLLVDWYLCFPDPSFTGIPAVFQAWEGTCCHILALFLWVLYSFNSSSYLCKPWSIIQTRKMIFFKCFSPCCGQHISFYISEASGVLWLTSSAAKNRKKQSEEQLLSLLFRLRSLLCSWMAFWVQRSRPEQQQVQAPVLRLR